MLFKKKIVSEAKAPLLANLSVLEEAGQTKRWHGGIVTLPFAAVKGSSWSVSRCLAAFPASVCGCVTFIDNVLTALMVQCDLTTSPSCPFLELHTFSSRKGEHRAVIATNKSLDLLSWTQPRPLFTN